MKLSDIIKFWDLSDRAAAERVKYYCCAIKAAEINNHGAAIYFTRRAEKWENLRVVAEKKLIEARS